MANKLVMTKCIDLAMDLPSFFLLNLHHSADLDDDGLSC
jgi:hypothetical protein